MDIAIAGDALFLFDGEGWRGQHGENFVEDEDLYISLRLLLSQKRSSSANRALIDASKSRLACFTRSQEVLSRLSFWSRSNSASSSSRSPSRVARFCHGACDGADDRLCRAELASGHIKANSRVADRKATGDGREVVIAAIFWLKTRAGWRKSFTHEVSGPGGAPIAIADRNASDVAATLLSLLNTALPPEGWQPGSLPPHSAQAGDPP